LTIYKSIISRKVLVVKRNTKAFIFSLLILSMSFGAVGAQVASPTPGATPTAIPPQPTLTPTDSVLNDATFSAFMNKRLPINASNAADIQVFFQWKAQGADISSLVFLPSDALVSTANDGDGSLQFPSMRLWKIQNDSLTLVSSGFEGIFGAIAIPSAHTN
jgi:hypothetical protein